MQTNRLLCYSNILIGAYGHRTGIVPSLGMYILALQITCHTVHLIPHQSIPLSFSICVRGVTCQNRYSLDMSCPIITHLSTPFSTPAGTRQRKPVCGTGNLYAYSTLLSTIFTLTEFMFTSVVKPMSARAAHVLSRLSRLKSSAKAFLLMTIGVSTFV